MVEQEQYEPEPEIKPRKKSRYLPGERLLMDLNRREKKQKEKAKEKARKSKMAKDIEKDMEESEDEDKIDPEDLVASMSRILNDF